MRKNLKIVAALLAISVSSCDEYKYKGENGKQVFETASNMSLEDAYKLFVESYTNTHPPMLDGAKALVRFGDKGKLYILNKAISAKDSTEFDADIAALMIAEYKCDDVAYYALSKKAVELKVNVSDVKNLCH